ncbi:hypothetical protein OS493_022121 [Desmophyllum pertusum]|uniref:Uncharacterized protein n=1 Tax=Desmophyllum pertusum TaxID=174260 RepID=A0A9W9YNT1_9CNID|nr:hypothetical protein OS493_022121 [Desmophyllum pertusum]
MRHEGVQWNFGCPDECEICSYEFVAATQEDRDKYVTHCTLQFATNGSRNTIEVAPNSGVVILNIRNQLIHLMVCVEKWWIRNLDVFITMCSSFDSSDFVSSQNQVS